MSEESQELYAKELQKGIQDRDMNQWIDNFFKLVSRYVCGGGRDYQCLRCGYIFSAKDGDELSKKAVEHLRGNCN